MKLADRYGPVLTGRGLAERILSEVADEAAAGGVVELDFARVEAVSPSFADELFGKLPRRVSAERIRFLNLSPHLSAVAKMAEQHRRLSS